MLKFIKSFFAKPEAPTVNEVPYKVETPVVSTPVAEQAVVESIAKVKKAPAAKKTTAAKKPRAPKAPK